MSVRSPGLKRPGGKPIYFASYQRTNRKERNHRMMDRCGIAAVAGALLSLSAPLLAQVPAALDRVPGDAHVITAVRNLEQFHSSMDAMAKQLGLPPEALDQLGTARQMLQTPGLNPQGSAAFAVMSVPDGSQNFIAILPVRDYRAFVTGLGGTGEGIDEVEVESETFFIKSIGDGFAAAAPRRDLTEGFAGRAGNLAAHEKALGEAGRAIAKDSSIFIVANIEALAPMLREGMEQFAGQAQMMAAMMGGGMGDFEHPMAIADSFIRDAGVAVMGMSVGEQGARLDFGAQFKEGSELGGFFTASGNAASLINSLPNQPFLMAVGIDASSPNLRTMLKKLVPPQAAGEERFQALNPLQALDMADGMGFLWGTSPALMGGLFLNTIAYTRTQDTAGYLKWVNNAFTKLNGQKIEGITYQTTMQEQRVADKPAHSWSMRMQIDQRHPGAQQASQMQMMLFGPGGLSGYMAPAQKGVVMTYSRNASNLEQALNAANTGKGLGEHEGIRRISKQLPEGRTMEGYIGIGSILETAMGVLGMMGMAPMDMEIPQDLPPIGMAANTSGGGMRMTLFVPTEVITTIQKLQAAMDGGDDWDDEDAGLPRF